MDITWPDPCYVLDLSPEECGRWRLGSWSMSVGLCGPLIRSKATLGGPRKSLTQECASSLGQKMWAWGGRRHVKGPHSIWWSNRGLGPEDTMGLDEKVKGANSWVGFSMGQMNDMGLFWAGIQPTSYYEHLWALPTLWAGPKDAKHIHGVLPVLTPPVPSGQPTFCTGHHRWAGAGLVIQMLKFSKIFEHLPYHCQHWLSHGTGRKHSIL